MATYATVADFEAYVVGWVTDDPVALEKYLVLAEREVDMALGNYSRVDLDTGLKINPATLEVWRRQALANAVCAQAEYRLIKGNAFFTEEVPLDPSGPDGSQKGREPVLAPKARRELSYGHLFKLTGVGTVPFPNQNIDDFVS